MWVKFFIFFGKKFVVLVFIFLRLNRYFFIYFRVFCFVFFLFGLRGKVLIFREFGNDICVVFEGLEIFILRDLSRA